MVGHAVQQVSPKVPVTDTATQTITPSKHEDDTAHALQETAVPPYLRGSTPNPKRSEIQSPWARRKDSAMAAASPSDSSTKPKPVDRQA